MLSVKPWKHQSVLRLIFSVFICIYAGSLLISAVPAPGAAPKAGPLFYLLLALALLFLGAALVLARRSWRMEKLLKQMLLLLACFYAGMICGAFAQKLAGAAQPSVGQMLISALSFQGAALLLVASFLREHQVSWNEAFGFNQRWRQALLLGVVVALIFLPIGWGLQAATARAMDKAAEKFSRKELKPEQQQAVQTLEMATGWLSRAALAIVTILLAPVAEEILFRGILYPWLKSAGFRRLALWGTAIVFATMHLNLVSFIPLVLLAIALTLLYEETDNLLAPISAHAFFNGSNFVLLYVAQHWKL